MTRQEYENVCKFLMDKEIQLSSNNSWLKSCIDLYKRSIETVSSLGIIEDCSRSFKPIVS